MSSPSLYAVYLGGDPLPGRLSEDHEVVFVVAGDAAEARKSARAKWKGSSRPHADALRMLDVVDGYAICLEPTTTDEQADVDVTYEPADGWD